MMSDILKIADRTFRSRLFLGTAGYPNRQILLDALAASGAEMATASIRRISLAGEEESLVDLLAGRVQFLPNTAGCQTAKDAVLTGSGRARCRHRHGVRRRFRHGARLRGGIGQHRGLQGARSGEDGGRDAGGGRGGAPRAACGAHSEIEERRAVEPAVRSRWDV